MDIERSLVDEIKKIDGVANAYGSSYVENIPATSSRAGMPALNIPLNQLSVYLLHKKV